GPLRPPCFYSNPLPSTPTRCAGRSRQRDYFAAVARAQGLERVQVGGLAQEAHGAVGEGEVGAARMAAAEGADPIQQRGQIAPRQHFVIDRHSGAERDLPPDVHACDVRPLSKAAEGTCTGRNTEPEGLLFRVTMVALAEEERVTGAVGDVY